jgi:hypothetical protein
LKQLQLIQILAINARRPAAAGDAAAKGAGINHLGVGQNAAEAVPATRTPPWDAGNKGFWGGWCFTAR